MLPSEQCLDKFMELCLFKVTHYFLAFWSVFLFHSMLPFKSWFSRWLVFKVLHNLCSAVWARHKIRLSCSNQTYLWSFIGNKMVMVSLISSLHICCCIDHIGIPNISTSHIHLVFGLLSFIQLSRWPSSLVLQGSGLQPALKSARVSKAMSALQSFVELLKGKGVLVLLWK